ncbi:sulfate transporter [Pseudomonas sp. HMWF032]|uniref:DUF3164 family protein n=1 Tax=Pseudomonas sp. HMWF032 TaxID=2056866 RepID=UPI000D36911D|nr:DUF3164 family protein [Pseudomonas sp. HMWF032]PTS85517.1 sulfate transporter [Pseudomonas sp. HMWF032]PTT82272.1 sulfate transporter [Pseudomonas sp. HMWF010]
MADINLTPVPPGYLRNAAGHFVPETSVREQDKLRDQVATELAKAAIVLNDQLAAFKKKALGDIADLVSIAAERYSVTIGGEKGNVTIVSFDGEYKVIRSYADRISFTEEMLAAKAQVLECVKSWTSGANAHLVEVVHRMLSPGRNGQIRTADVLEMLRWEIDDEDWKRAMQAVKDSILVSGTAVYVRIYKRISGDKYEAVPLDLAAV